MQCMTLSTLLYSDHHLIFGLKLFNKSRLDLLNKRAWGANGVPCRKYAVEGSRQPENKITMNYKLDSKLDLCLDRRPLGTASCPSRFAAMFGM